MVKPWAGWGRHTSCELWRTVCKVPRCVNLQQGCSGSWYRTAARSSLGHHVWVRVSSVTWELHTQGCVAQRVWPMAQRQRCPSEGQREQLDEAIRNPPSLRGQHHPGLCIPASVRSSLPRLFWKSNKCTAAASHQHPWKRNWLHCGKDVGVFTSAPQLVVIIILFSSYL